MYQIFDCLSDTVISAHESKIEADMICESMGGKNNCYYVFTKESKCDKVKESAGNVELTLF